MRTLTLLLITILSCKTLQSQTPVSIYIAYDDKSVLVTENVCDDFFSFKKKFQEKFPNSKIYHYILPKINLVIQFDLGYLSKLFNTDSKQNREIIYKYYLAIENKFPDYEKSLNFKTPRPEITLSLPQCEYPKNITEKILELSIEYQGHRAFLSRFSHIQIRPENIPESYKKYQIEIKILMNDTLVSENEVRKYFKHMKTLQHYPHEIKIVQ